MDAEIKSIHHRIALPKKRVESKDDLRKYLHLISEYDGLTTSFKEFMSEIDGVLPKLTENEKISFLELVRENKITGKAKIMSIIYDIRTRDELFEILHLYSNGGLIRLRYRTDRSMCKQGKHGVLDYSKRFNAAHSIVQGSIITDIFLSDEDKKCCLAAEDKYGLTEYILGLNKCIIQILQDNCYPRTLKIAQKLALDIERIEFKRSLQHARAQSSFYDKIRDIMRQIQSIILP